MIYINTNTQEYKYSKSDVSKMALVINYFYHENYEGLWN